MRGFQPPHPHKRKRICTISRAFFGAAAILLVLSLALHLTHSDKGVSTPATARTGLQKQLDNQLASSLSETPNIAKTSVPDLPAKTDNIAVGDEGENEEGGGEDSKSAVDDQHKENRLYHHDEDRGELDRPGMISMSMPQRNNWVSNVSWHEEWEFPWPFYKIGVEEGTGHKGWPWPGVGWLHGAAFDMDAYKKSFRFYMYDDGPFNMEAANKCYRRRYKLDEDWHNLDRNVRLMQREHFADLFLLPALRDHPLRTRNPDEASVFVLGYTPCLAYLVQPCPEDGVKEKEQWENDIADALLASPHFAKHNGADHFIIHMKYAIRISKRLETLIEGGVVAATIDRDYWLLIKFLKKTYQRGSVLIMPYVSSSFLDIDTMPPMKSSERDQHLWYFFRGTMKRKHAGASRPLLYELGNMVQGADFQGVVLNKKDGSIFGILNKTASQMRRSPICLCPEGDSPTSLRVFEALAAGCVPVIMVDRVHISTDLPFPTLIDWDKIALFTHSIGDVKDHDGNLMKMAAVLEGIVGKGSGQDLLARIERMREEGRKVFDKYFSYLRNPAGITDGFLVEAWVQVQRKGILQGPYFNQPAAERRKAAGLKRA